MLSARGWLATGLLLVSAGAAAAQDRSQLQSISLEGRAELAFPTGEMRTGLGLDEGFGLGVAARYRFTQALAVYLGWDRFRFRGDADAAETVLTDSGFRLGGQLYLPGSPSRPVVPFVTAGLLYDRVEVERTLPTGTVRDRADRGAGAEGGVGALISLGRGIRIIPEGRYRSHSPELDGSGRVSYFGVNLGLALRMF